MTSFDFQSFFLSDQIHRALLWIVCFLSLIVNTFCQIKKCFFVSFFAQISVLIVFYWYIGQVFWTNVTRELLYRKHSSIFRFDLSWSVEGWTTTIYGCPGWPLSHQSPIYFSGASWELKLGGDHFILWDVVPRYYQLLNQINFHRFWDQVFAQMKTGGNESTFGSKFFTLSGAFCYRRMNPSSWLDSNNS